jgi:hypothetical protein
MTTQHSNLQSKVMRWIFYFLTIILFVLFIIVYVYSNNRIHDFAIELYGVRESEYLYNLPPFDQYCIRLPSGTCYNSGVYLPKLNGHNIDPLGDYKAFNDLVDPKTFRFVREDTSYGTAFGNYIFEDTNYEYTLMLEAEFRIVGKPKPIKE